MFYFVTSFILVVNKHFLYAFVSIIHETHSFNIFIYNTLKLAYFGHTYDIFSITLNYALVNYPLKFRGHGLVRLEARVNTGGAMKRGKQLAS